jgi:hypothetical protein
MYGVSRCGFGPEHRRELVGLHSIGIYEIGWSRQEKKPSIEEVWERVEKK